MDFECLIPLLHPVIESFSGAGLSAAEFFSNLNFLNDLNGLNFFKSTRQRLV